MNDSQALRMTQSRKAILSVLAGSMEHPTAEEVHRMVRRGLPRISLGTVYRNLDELARHGLVRTVNVAGAQRRYDAVLSDHHHVVCEKCGRIEDVEVRDAQRLEALLVDGKGYQVHGCSLCFTGVCRECAGNDTHHT
jgi:Fur family ferric uptake transcriptional regulator